MEVNGVTLPDIPADVSATYPYVTIFNFDYESGHKGNMFLASKQPFFYCKGSIFGLKQDEYVGSLGDGVCYERPEDLASWSFEFEGTAGQVINPVGYWKIEGNQSAVYTVIWANHDIYELTAVDLTIGKYNTGRMYFRNSNDPLPERVSVSSSFMEDTADIVREWLPGLVLMSRLSVAQIQAFLPYLKPINRTVSGFSLDSSCYKSVCTNVRLFSLEYNMQYIVKFDGLAHLGRCRNFTDSASGETWLTFGNHSLIGGSDSTNTSFGKMPFCIVERNGSTEIYTSASGTSHTLSATYLADID